MSTNETQKQEELQEQEQKEMQKEEQGQEEQTGEQEKPAEEVPAEEEPSDYAKGYESAFGIAYIMGYNKGAESGSAVNTADLGDSPDVYMNSIGDAISKMSALHSDMRDEMDTHGGCGRYYAMRALADYMEDKAMEAVGLARGLAACAKREEEKASEQKGV